MTMKMETINSSPIKFGNPKKKKYHEQGYMFIT